jgi:hypothetical protein
MTRRGLARRGALVSEPSRYGAFASCVTAAVGVEV